MKTKLSRILVLSAALLVAVSAGAFAQLDLNQMQDDFETFSGDVANGLPFASTTGLNWSDAKVRGFPHFGVGLSIESAFLPSAAFEDLADSLDVDLPSEVTGALGVPFPGYALDARVGIPVLPIDVGAKFGIITQGMADAISGATGVEADYTLVGFDVRYPIIGGGVVLPAVTASAGYNYLGGGITTEVDGLGTTISTDAGPITVDDPKLRFAWKTNSLDFKLQASKGLLIFTPTVGLGYTYGWSEAGGGIAAGDVTYPSGFEDAYDIESDDEGFTILSKSTGGAFRAFAGTQINLTVFKLDLNAKYNFSSGNLGAGINARFQI
jgi:hypothetical protein